MKQQRAPAVSSDTESDSSAFEAPEVQPSSPEIDGSGQATAPPPPPGGGGDGGELPFLSELEAAFGHPLGHIPVTLGDPSVAEVGATGTADERGVHFASTSPPKDLVAEEVAHYEQRELGASDEKLLGHHGDAPEREAKSVAAKVAAGQPAPEIRQVSTAEVQRDTPTPAPDPQADAERLRRGMRTRNEDDITYVLGQGASHVRAVRAAYDAAGGAGLVEDLRRAYVVQEKWEFVSMLLERAGIDVPRVEVQRGSEGWGIRPDPSLASAVPGTRQRFTFYTEARMSDARSTTSVKWYCVNDARAVQQFGAPVQVEGPEDGPWDAVWAFPGTHTIYARVQDHNYGMDPSPPVWLEYSQTVVSLDDRMRAANDSVQATDFVTMRAGLEFQRIQASGGVQAEQSGGPGAHIAVQGANPAVPGVAPNLSNNVYTVQGLTGRGRHWYAVPDDARNMPTRNFYGLQATTWQGQYALDMGTGETASLPIAQSGSYTIVCEELDASGRATGNAARYRQVVLTDAQNQQLSALNQEIGLIDGAMTQVDRGTRTPCRAVYINQETGQQVQLMLFVGRASQGAGAVLIDATPGVRRKEYSGTTVIDAINDFRENNSYPRGRISLSVNDPLAAQPQPIAQTLETDGSSSWSEWASATGWASLGLFVAGAVATVVPGGQVVAPFLFAAGAATGAASGGMSIYDELQNAQPSAGKIAINALGIASSILGGGAAIMAVKNGAGVTLTGFAGRFFVYGALGADIGSAVLITGEGIDQIARVTNDPAMSESDKIRAVCGILVMLGLQGGLIWLGARDAGAVRRQLGARLGEEVASRLDDRTLLMLSRLDEGSMASLSGASAERLTRIGSLLDGGRTIRIEGEHVVVDGRRMRLSELDALGDDALNALKRGDAARVRPPEGSPELQQWLREGVPGQIRDESMLSNADVASVMNGQLQNVSPSQIDSMIASFPAEQQALARRMLARSSGFGSMEGLGKLYEALQAYSGKTLYLPGGGSVADNLAYMAQKGLFGTGATLRTVRELEFDMVVVVDDVLLARIARDHDFALDLVDCGAVLINPRGMNSGINLFNATDPDAIRNRLSGLVTRAGAGGDADAAAARVLDEDLLRQLDAADPRLRRALQTVDPAAAGADTSAAIANSLNGGQGITANEVEAALSQLPPQYRAMARELLVQQSQVLSPRTFAQKLLEHHRTLESMAAGREMYFYIYRPNKSYSTMALAHQEVTGTSPDRYITGANEFASRRPGPNSVVVILDDVAGSGNSLQDAFESLNYRGDVIVAPMLSTTEAANLFGGMASANPNLRYAPQGMVQSLESSELFRNLTPDQQAMMRRLVGNQGFGNNGLSTAFPYMAPDNNNEFFGSLVAPYFLANRTAGASKSTGYTPPAN
ncbi:MAG: hypothetical protein ABMA64_15400 [Myxococcota bacterium]